MSSVDEHSVAHVETETEATIARNARNGLILFGVYVLFYIGFTYLNAFQPKLMASTPFGGLNLALIYGMALIVFALVLALIYMWQCKAAKRKQ